MNAYVESAHRAGLPQRAVWLRCRNWGVPAGLREQIAEEAAAEALARSLAHEFRDEGHFRAWATRTAINLAIDALRRLRRDRPLPAEAAAGEPGERRPEWEQLLARLDCETGRAILRLSYVEGRTLDEIAARLAPAGRSANAGRLWVKRRRDGALKVLRAGLVGDGWGG